MNPRFAKPILVAAAVLALSAVPAVAGSVSGRGVSKVPLAPVLTNSTLEIAPKIDPADFVRLDLSAIRMEDGSWFVRATVSGAAKGYRLEGDLVIMRAEDLLAMGPVAGPRGQMSVLVWKTDPAICADFLGRITAGSYSHDLQLHKCIAVVQ